MTKRALGPMLAIVLLNIVGCCGSGGPTTSIVNEDGIALVGPTVSYQVADGSGSYGGGPFTTGTKYNAFLDNLPSGAFIKSVSGDISNVSTSSLSFSFTPNCDSPEIKITIGGLTGTSISAPIKAGGGLPPSGHTKLLPSTGKKVLMP